MNPKREMNEKFFFDPFSKPTPPDELTELTKRLGIVIKNLGLTCEETGRGFNRAVQHMGRSSR